mmetsp:Transcript_6327/g.8387  ORF Transcript_6327/g.8387 Transcript_6327/m.8387 type:complete len:467 (+) Transcript_6327:34-1434(+)
MNVIKWRHSATLFTWLGLLSAIILSIYADLAHCFLIPIHTLRFDCQQLSSRNLYDFCAYSPKSGSNFHMIGVTVTKQRKYFGGRFFPTYLVGLGSYNGEDAAFLAQTPSITSPRQEVLPVPVLEGSVALLKKVLDSEVLSKTDLLLNARNLINRDGGLYDNLPWESWGGQLSKRGAFNKFNGAPTNRKGFENAYALMWECIEEECRAEVLSGVIERDDSLPYGYFLGGAVGLRKKPEFMTILGETVKKPFSGGEEIIVNCNCDEAIGLSMARKEPILVDSEVWDSAALQVNFRFSADGKLVLDINIEGDLDTTSKAKERLKNVPKAWEIKRANIFFNMDEIKKRECLYASGLTKLPRSREGVEKLDKMLLPLMDEKVRRAIQVQQAVAQGNYELAVQLESNKSERQIVSEQLERAKNQGITELVERLEERIFLLESAKMDITLDEGTYQKDLDADEWYLQNRKNMM